MKNVETIYSLSPLQHGLLFHSVYEPASRVYHQQLSLRIDGPLDLEAFTAAWQAIMARHAVLRTAFLWEDLDDAYQVVLRELPLPLTVLDWRGRFDADADADAALARLEDDEHAAPFDLTRPPLMRLHLVRLRDQRWQLVWTHHHIALDGWSVGLVLKEWLALYRELARTARAGGPPPALPPVRPYQDYIAWLAEQDEQAATAYWRGQLADLSEPTPLPDFSARRRLGPVLTSAPHAEQTLHLDAARTRALTDFCRAQRITQSTLIQGAWALLLGRHADRDDVLFGVTLAGRPAELAGADNMVGLFINTLPLRVRWTEDARLGDWLRRLQATGAEMRQVEHTSLARLKALSSIPAQSALFDSIVVFENFPIDASLAEHSGDLRFTVTHGSEHAVADGVRAAVADSAPSSVRRTQGRNSYPLSLIVVPDRDTLALTLSYASARFSDHEIRILLAQLDALLAAMTMTANADTPVPALRWLSDAEQSALLDWGTGEPLAVPPLCLHTLFERHADAHPHQDALVGPDQTLSYAALDARANRLAHHLMALGVAPGHTVGVALERCPDFVIAVLAVLKAGAAYLPLDVKHPPARLAALVQDSGAQHLVSATRWQQALSRCLSQHAATPVWLDAVDAELAALSDRRPVLATDVEPASPAYLIYTSGSAGQPKGVLVEHGAIVAYLSGVLHALDLPPQSRFSMVSTVAADLGHTQLFGALMGGGTLCLASEDIAFDPGALAGLLARQHIDVLKITPGHLRGLLAAHDSADLLPRHTLIFGGEALDAALVAHVRRLAPGLRIVNHYGPTEATVGAALHRVTGLPAEAADAPDAGDAAPIPLGKPQPNRRLYVLDPHGQPVPVGVPGELHIGGAAIARGYLGRPELTAERFVPDPFAGGEARMYRTGDRVRWLESGELLFLGRVDNQIKVRGHRVELGEVESQVKRLSPHIQQVVARLVHPPDQQPRLVAYIVASQSLSADMLRRDLGMRVPDYMVPSAFIPLDAIPLNANGKPDHKQLPLPDAPAASRQDHTPPRNDVERLLVDIWQAVLRVEPIGVHDSFFTLGGDSILSLQIIARANQQGLTLTPKQLFEHRTVAGLAAVLCPDAAIAPEGERREDVPMTAGQLARLAAGPLAPTWRCVALDGKVTVDVIERAVAAVVQHHRALALALAPGPGPDATWRQTQLATPRRVSVSRQHAAPGDQNRRRMAPGDHAALAALAERCMARLDLAGGEGLHACLLEEGEGAAGALLLVAHPLLVDEESWPLILADLALALAQLAHGRPLSLAPTGGELADWACHQRDYAQSEELDAAWEHWLQHAGAELPALDLPASAELASHTVRMDPETTQRLERLRARMHVDWTALLTTALAAELATELATGLDDTLASTTLVIDVVHGGRPDSAALPLAASIARTDLDPGRIVGALSHPVPLFLDWHADAAPIAQLQSVAAQLAAQPQRGADYGVLRYLSDNAYLQEPLLSLPRAQVGLAVLGDLDAHLEPHGVLGEVLATSAAPAGDHALQVSAYLRQGQLCLACQGPLATAWTPRLQARLAALSHDRVADHVAPAAHAFPCVARDQDLGDLLGDAAIDWAQIEDVYPLSPMQQGMLLHTLLQPRSGIYLMQQRYRWDGPLDREALAHAWQQLLARHPTLRTGFRWHEDRAPVQCVYRQVEPAFAWYDWRAHDPAAQAQQLDAVLAAERHQGFDMRRAPLTHLRVFHVGEQRYIVTRSFHHILTDAWCFGILMQDLFALYQAALLRQPVARPLARPFRDYMRWLARQDLDAAQRFWQAELAGFAEPTPMVVDTLPGAQAGAATEDSALHEAEDVDITLGVAQTRALLALCQEHQLTPNTWIQGAWALLLARYSGRRDVLFGVTVAGRPTDLRGVEDIVGLFINSLPLRVAVDDESTVIPWLQRLLAANVDIRRYEYAPLVDIQRWSEVERGRLLFDSLVVFENAPLDLAHTAQDLQFNIDIYEDRVHTNYPITVVVYPGDRLGIRISYDRRRFTRDTIERMLGHLAELLSDMLARSQANLGALRMLPDAERQQLLHDWNRTETEFPLDSTYAALFARRVAAHPERVAAVCDGETITYAALHQRACRLARALVAAGARRDIPVALLAERGLPLLTMMIAVLEAGAAMQLLDVNHPPQRLSELVALSQAPIVLASERAAALSEEVAAAVPGRPACLVAEALWLQGEVDEQPAAQPAGRPDDLAYVVFTSGSTGTPKGAMVEQRGMLNNIYGKVPGLGLSEADRIAQTASPAFDIVIWQFLSAPLLGATVHILPDPVAHDPARLLEAIEEHGLTILEAVPAVMRSMLEVCPPELSLRSLRWVMPTGEALPPALCRQWFARFPHVPLMNAYGPAECSDDVAFHAITAPPPEDCLHMPIGRATANNRLYLLDEASSPVPVGVPGEICVAGAGVGRGYLGDPVRTRAAFVPDPFEPGARMYRTGDIGRWRPDGLIEFLGRKDQQVKVRGHRIELGEIESRLARHQAVDAAAVLAVRDARGDARLIAYWQARPGAAAEAAELADHLARELPAYMVPAAFVQMEALPLNANGKIDRKALAARQDDLSEALARPYVAPRTDTERQLASLWAEILAVPQVGVDDSFFALGGHSLLATQVISRIRGRFQVELPLRALFERPTVAQLAVAVDEAGERQQGAAVLPPITPRSQTKPDTAPSSMTNKLPLSFAQQRLWFQEQLQGSGNLFTIPFALRLTGPLDVPALQASFEALIARHEVLRTAIIAEQGEPWQVIQPPEPFALPCIDLSTLDPAARQDPQQTALARALDAALAEPFDLQRPPLVRARLVRLGAEEHVLVVALHHMAVDGWSMAMLVDDLMTAYRAARQGASPALPRPALQYADYALWQRQHLPGSVWQQQMAYWRRQLAGSQPLLLLPGAQRKSAAGASGARLRRRLPRALASALEQRAERHGATLFMVLHAALGVLLHQQTGRDDLLIGTDVANRHHRETESIVGFFVNQLVLRCRLHGDQRVADLMAACQRTALDAYQHQDLPFDALVAELLPQRDAHHAPFFQIKLVLQNTPQRDFDLPELAIEELDLEPRAVELDLLINVVAGPDGLLVVYDHRVDLYPSAYIEQLAALFETALSALAESDAHTVASLAERLRQREQDLHQHALDAARAERDQQRAALARMRRKPVAGATPRG